MTEFRLTQIALIQPAEINPKSKHHTIPAI